MGGESVQWVERVSSGWRECPVGGESVQWVERESPLGVESLEDGDSLQRHISGVVSKAVGAVYCWNITFMV